jgi:hypothetical protein
MLSEAPNSKPMSFTDSTGATFAGFGIVDEADQDLQTTGEVTLAGHTIVVTVEKAAFEGLAAAATLNVNGTDYRVVQVRQIEDGTLLRAWCARKT